MKHVFADHETQVNIGQSKNLRRTLVPKFILSHLKTLI